MLTNLLGMRFDFVFCVCARASIGRLKLREINFWKISYFVEGKRATRKPFRINLASLIAPLGICAFFAEKSNAVFSE